MKHFNLARFAAIASVLSALFLASPASATTLEVKGVRQNSAVAINVSLAPGTSALIKDETGTTVDTCTETTNEGTTVSPFTVAGKGPIGGPIKSMKIGGCTHTTDILNPGSISISWISGTNGTVTAAGSEITTLSTVFGLSSVCKTGSGTDIGTLTGKASGQATVDVSGTLDCGIIGKVQWTSTYVITSPEGLGVVE
jgi:hypothetical protein